MKALAVLVLPLVVGCAPRSGLDAAGRQGPGASADGRPWCVAPEEERRRLESDVDRLGTARGEELLDVGRRILERGEAGVPILVAALKSDVPERRGQAAYLLGFAKDRRSIEPLAEVLRDDVPAVRYEAAGALLELRDPRGLSVLIGGLEDRDARLRAKCLAVLAERTGQRFGFEADGAVEDRAAAVRRWRTWLSQK